MGPDPAFVDEAAASLEPCPQERIGSAADSQPVFVGQTQQGGTLSPVETKRLFKVDVLAGPEGGGADFGMGPRNGEIADDLDIAAGQELADRHGPQPIPFGRRLGAGVFYICARDVGDVGIVSREIGLADLAAANQANLCSSCLGQLFTSGHPVPKSRLPAWHGGRPQCQARPLR